MSHWYRSILKGNSRWSDYFWLWVAAAFSVSSAGGSYAQGIAQVIAQEVQERENSDLDQSVVVEKSQTNPTQSFSLGAGLIDNYGPFQVESLTDQGDEFMRQGLYNRAVDSYTQAVQINRISLGLYNRQQAQVIESLLGALFQQKNWPEFDQQLDYLRWLQRRTLANEPEAMAIALVRQSDWYRAAAAEVVDSKSSWYLIQAKYLDWQAVSELEQLYGKHDIRLMPYLYRVVLDHYYQSISVKRQGMTSFEFKTKDKVIVNGFSYSKNESQQRSYSIGLEILQRLRQINQETANRNIESDAILMIYQADWEYLNGKREVARDLYQASFQALLGAGIAATEIERFFNRVVVLPIPNLQLSWPGETDDGYVAEVSYQAWSTVYPGAQEPNLLHSDKLDSVSELLNQSEVLQVKFKLSTTASDGAPVNRNVAEMDIADRNSYQERDLEKAFHEISLLQFRPKFQEGELVNHENVVVNYSLAVTK